jgi:hypothetical protein
MVVVHLCRMIGQVALDHAAPNRGH